MHFATYYSASHEELTLLGAGRDELNIIVQGKGGTLRFTNPTPELPNLANPSLTQVASF